MAYTGWKASRLTHKANQRLFTILRITWERYEGLNMQKGLLAYESDLGLHRDIWASKWFFLTFVS